MGHTKNKTSEEKENESKPDKDRAKKPTAGKENVGLDLDLGKDIGKDIESNFVKEKTKVENKDADSSINTIEKDETGGDKDLKLFDKDGHLDIKEKVGSPTKDLGMEFLDIVLIDSNQTAKDKTKDGEMDKGQKITHGPQYTILNLTEDEKENILYEIDIIPRGNNTEFLNSNDIEDNLGTLPQKETEELPTVAAKNSTAIIPTVITTTERVTTRVTPTEKVKVDTVNEKTTEQDLQQETNLKNGGEYPQVALCNTMNTMIHIH